ncbi:alpha/beta fold hydrolase [Flavitalea sp. BT771]|uniref:alpha/beta fold hydrolase n=1 Tax=Flavitalea sp. BT771 TaxID=3063329 RepID=UPI0026E3547A|nr:alpha/beta fold hydrolase [Flavitalea sp. BT771]MDO6433270.1 alpha/beta fold hydrolase [Flavitalea sp. BT771]MDV6222825.1 alpha/beta fold hydrolase [Flavitalea sp. BT771]
MQQLSIRGIQLHYDDRGEGSPIVFVHGHPFDHTMWKYQLPRFAPEHRLIMPDLRGYGHTDVTPGKVMLDEMALDILHLLDALHIDNAVFCGLSMGGQIVLECYRIFPHKVKALVIVDSDARGETPDSRQQRLQKADRIIATGMRQHTDETIHQYIAPASMNNPPVYTHLYDMMSSTTAEGAAAAHRGRADRRDHLSFLPSIRVPTLVVVGEEDYFTPPPIARLMSDRIPGAALAVIPAAGHLPNMETPEAFNETLYAFLKTHRL